MDSDSEPVADDGPVLDQEALEKAAEGHEISPEHIQGVEIETVDPAEETSLDVPRRRAGPRGVGVDLGEFGPVMHSALKDVVAGYMWQVRHNGTLASAGQWNWAQTPADAGFGWTPDTRMHVASVSKYLTAVGMVHLLRAKKISLDSAISSHLPGYWPKGPNVGKITFRHLLTHTSGLSTGNSDSDFGTMKFRVALGVSGVGSYQYANMNFGLCRILMATINGDIDVGATFPALNDAIWDVTTISAYRSYMQKKVFTPAGVSKASFAPAPFALGSALAYPWPFAGVDGWNSGDLATMSGGAGWRLSMNELLKVMDHARRRNTILPSAVAQDMLDDRLGIDQAISTSAGTLYNKNGMWRRNGRTEQCVAYFWPGGMEMAVFVNSPIGPGASLRNLVRDAFEASL